MTEVRDILLAKLEASRAVAVNEFDLLHRESQWLSLAKRKLDFVKVCQGLNVSVPTTLSKPGENHPRKRLESIGST